MGKYCGPGGRWGGYGSLSGAPKFGNGWVKAGDAEKWNGLGCCRLGVGSESRVLTRDRTSGDVEDCCGEGVLTAMSVSAVGEIGDVVEVASGFNGSLATSRSKYGLA